MVRQTIQCHTVTALFEAKRISNTFWMFIECLCRNNHWILAQIRSKISISKVSCKTTTSESMISLERLHTLTTTFDFGCAICIYGINIVMESFLSTFRTFVLNITDFQIRHRKWMGNIVFWCVTWTCHCYVTVTSVILWRIVLSNHPKQFCHQKYNVSFLFGCLIKLFSTLGLVKYM